MLLLMMSIRSCKAGGLEDAFIIIDTVNEHAYILIYTYVQDTYIHGRSVLSRRTSVTLSNILNRTVFSFEWHGTM